MFTGIVRTVGRIEALNGRGGDVELVVGSGGLDLATAAVGDSICVAGACLTITRIQEGAFDIPYAATVADLVNLRAACG